MLALLSLEERLKTEMGIIFLTSSEFYGVTKIPFEFILFLLGIYYSIRKREFILLTILVFFVLPPLLVLPLNRERYYYTVIPFIFIIAGASLNIFKELRKEDKKYGNFLKSRYTC
jgi:uncharacterized membrane protein